MSLRLQHNTSESSGRHTVLTHPGNDKDPRQPEQLSKKNKSGGITVPDPRIRHNVMVRVTVRCQHQDKPREGTDTQHGLSRVDFQQVFKLCSGGKRR